MTPKRIGVVGCGMISEIYFQNIAKFDNLKVTAIADVIMERAEEKAKIHGGKAMTVDELMQSPDVDIVLNLTNPAFHYEIDMKALNAGKNVYSEKPLAATIEQGKEILATAKKKGLYVGCAPDTFMGARAATMRKMLDDGWIGEPIGATMFFMNCGMEMWHPNPEPWYKVGAGPVFDNGPYYAALLVNMFGPAKRICSVTGNGFKKRTITCGPKNGQEIDVEIPTYVTANIEFADDVIVTMILTFDVAASHLPALEIYGKEGTLSMEDQDPYDGPNNYGGEISIRRREDADFVYFPRAEGCSVTPWNKVPLIYGYTENSRALGLSDMAYAMEHGGSYRANGEFAYHCLEILHGILESGRTNTYYELQSTCEKPEVMKSNQKMWTMEGSR